MSSGRSQTRHPIKRLEDVVIYVFVQIVAAISKTLPLRWTYQLGEALGEVVFCLVPRYRKVALANLRRVFGKQKTDREIRSLCRRNFRLFGKNLVEFLLCPSLDSEDLKELVELRGAGFLKEGLREGRGAILLTAHFGNWEWLGARVCAEGLPLSVIARHPDNPAISRLVERVRRHCRMKIIPRQAVREALRALRNNEILAILPDQHAGPSGIFVPFFGHPASTFPGIAALARRTDAPVVAGFAVRQKDNRHVVTFYPPLKLHRLSDSKRELQLNTALCTKVIEEQIKSHPDHWLWFHDRWKTEPPKAEGTP